MQHETREGVEIVRLEGSVDASVVGALRAQLDTLLEEGVARFAFDFSGARLLDSSGISLLVRTMERSREKGGNVALFAVPDTIDSVLRLARLHRVLDIVDDEAAAIAALHRPHD